jgi:hypothetical protein
VTLAHLQSVDFWALVDMRGEDDCWLFKITDGISRPTLAIPAGVTGLGTVRYRGARAAKSLATGRLVPRHLVVDHLCFNPPCVNPKHLDVVTQRTNLKRRRMPANA